MTAADEAFAEAERLIATAKRTGATELSFDTAATHALTRLPNSIATLAKLTHLDLDNTQVSDLTPLAGMVGMTTLWLRNTQVSDLIPLAGMVGMTRLYLDNTQVSDLTPLAGMARMTMHWLDNTPVSDLRVVLGMPKLATEPEAGGLEFKGTTFTRSDARAAEIAGIADNTARAAALFEYLGGGKEEPDTLDATATPIDPDPILRSLIHNGQLDIQPDTPTEVEVLDKVKRALHERLRRLMPELAQKAGNHFPRLAARARALTDQVDKPFSDLDLLTLHLEIEDLEDRREKGTEDDAPFTEEVSSALKAVTNIGPGLTLDHPDVDVMLDRRRRAREEVVVASDEAKHRALSLAIIADPAANSIASRDLEELIERIADRTAARVLSRAKHKNHIVILAIVAASAMGQVGTNVIANLISDAYGPSITAFVQGNWGLLLDVVGTYGQGAVVWFQNTVGPLVAGIDTTLVRPIEGRKSRRP